MTEVILPSAIRTNLLVLQQTEAMLAATQRRLATGKRVNGPLDGPAAYFTASALAARAQRFHSLLDSISIGRMTLEAAGNAIQTVRELVESARTIAQQALSSPGTVAKITGTVSGLSATTSISMGNGKTVTVSDGTVTATYTHSPGKQVQDFLNAVNNTGDLQVTASLTTDGRIELKAIRSNVIVIGGTASSNELANLGLSAGTTSGILNQNRYALAQSFDVVRAQIDSVAADAGYHGTNLLAGGSLSVILNETGSSKLDIAGLLVDVATLGIQPVTSGDGDTFQGDTEINAVLDQLNAALNTLATHAAVLASKLAVLQIREEFSRSLAQLLQDGADNLVLADMDEERAMFLALETRRQFAAISLSLASGDEHKALFGL